MRKGVSTAITIILVLLITVSLILISYQWLLKYSPWTQWEIEKSLERKEGCLKIENMDLDNKKITVRNCGEFDLSNFIVYIDDEPFVQYSGTLGPGYIEQISYTEDISFGEHGIQVSSDYAESSKIIFYYEPEIPLEECDVYIYQSMIPYEITENNKIYCLAENIQIDGQTAIDFSSGVQNSILECGGFVIDGNDSSGTDGVYLTGSNTKNNTVKNCNITDFYFGIYLLNEANNNLIIDNTLSSNSNRGIFLNNTSSISIINNTLSSNPNFGIFLLSSSNITLYNNIVSNSGYGIYLQSSSNNTLNNNTVKSNIYGLSLYLSYNNRIRDGSVALSSTQDYRMISAGDTNSFNNTNFTSSRSIYFSSSTSWFNYHNDTGNIWLKTRVSSSATVTRELIYWFQNLIQWNDTSDTTRTATYNITGLETNTVYYVYNNSIFTYSLDSGPNGEISFTIDLPQNEEHEIKVERSTFDSSVLWFKFNEARGTDVYDSSSYNNDGVFYDESFNDGTLGDGTCSPGSGTCPERVDGYFGNALKFNGNNRYVSVPDHSSLDGTGMNSFTIGAWINLDLFQASYQRVVHKNFAYHMYIDSSNRKPVCGHYGGENWQVVYPINTIQLDQWYYVTCVYNHSRLSIYINGDYENSISKSDDTPDTSDPLMIGLDEDLSTYDFNGTIDEVRIWNRALTQTEIQAEMQSSLPVSSPVASWSFDEEDSARYANDTHIWVKGNKSSALSFDGVNDYVQAPHDSSLSGFTEFTASFWMRQYDITRRQAILYKWGGGGPYGWFIDGPSYFGQDLGFYASEDGSSYIEWHADYDPIPGLWYYITVVWKANEHAQFYVNGAPITLTSSPASTISQIYYNVGAPFLVGKCPYYSTRYFDGIIDEVRIWNRVLTQAEIQEEMNRS